MDFMELIKRENDITKTENGATVYSTSGDRIVDLFAKIGALRNTNENVKWGLFTKALAEDNELTMKVLFYARDAREGQGERDTFRQIFTKLGNVKPSMVIENLENVIKYGRYDDLIYVWEKTESTAVAFAIKQLIMSTLSSDLVSEAPSLLGKWMPSNNTSSKKTVNTANWISTQLRLTPREYRKVLSALRKKIKIVESFLSANKTNEIDYEKVPSLAMTKYRTAFFTKDADRFSDFLTKVEKGEKTIKAGVLYPYDIVRGYDFDLGHSSRNEVNRVLEAQWKALPDYMEGKPYNGIVCADTSGSMYGLPMDVAISLALYISEKNTSEVFGKKFITFSEKPVIQSLVGDTLVEKLKGVKTIVSNTNVEAVFDLILNTAQMNFLDNKDIPSQLMFISDMQFDSMTTQGKDRTFMLNIKQRFEDAGYTMPKIVFWNVNAVGAAFPMQIDEHGIQYVSGCSPVILKTLLKGNFLSPLDIVKETVLTERYESIKF